MTSRSMFLRNQLSLRNNFDISYAKKDIPVQKFQLGQVMTLGNDLIEQYQSVSFAKPAPIWKVLLNPFNYVYNTYYLGVPIDRHYGWTKDNPQIWGLTHVAQYVLDGSGNNVQISDLFTDGGVDKLADTKYREESLRGPWLEILMDYLMELNQLHGYGLPKFKKIGPTGVLTEFDPFSLGSINRKITVDDLPSFQLYGHSWYYNLYIAQIQDWLDQLSKVLKFPNGPSITAWLPKISFASDDQQFNEDVEDPNMRKHSWSPKAPADIGKYGKPYRNYHHRVFPNQMNRADYPVPLEVQGYMPLQAMTFYNDVRSPALDAFIPIDTLPVMPAFGPGQIQWNKESDGNYYIYQYNPIEIPKKYFKARVANIAFSKPAMGVSGPIYPVGGGTGFSTVPDVSTPFSWYQDGVNWYNHYINNTTSGRQYFAPFWNVMTHKIYLFYTGGQSIGKRYGIKATNPKTYFDFKYENNVGYYSAANMPIFPAPRDLSPSAITFGKRAFDTVKLTVGKIDFPGGRYLRDLPVYDFAGGQVPPPPFLYNQRMLADGTLDPRKSAYLPSDKAILDEVAGKIDSGEATTIAEYDLASMPVSYYGGGIDFASFPLGGNFTDVHVRADLVDMTPLFELTGGQYVFVCVSFHDFFNDFMPGINNTYDLIDAWNAATGTGRTKNFGMSPYGLGDGQTLVKGYFVPGSDTFSQNPNFYYPPKILSGEYPGPMQYQWQLGTGTDGVWGAYGLRTHTDGYVWR